MKKRAPTAMQRYRRRLRARGLRPVQLWLPDTRSARFVKEFQRQARLVAAREAGRARGERKALDALMDSQGTTGWTS